MFIIGPEPSGLVKRRKVFFWIYQFSLVRIPTTQELEMRSPVKRHGIELVGLIYPPREIRIKW